MDRNALARTAGYADAAAGDRGVERYLAAIPSEGREDLRRAMADRLAVERAESHLAAMQDHGYTWQIEAAKRALETAKLGDELRRFRVPSSGCGAFVDE